MLEVSTVGAGSYSLREWNKNPHSLEDSAIALEVSSFHSLEVTSLRSLE